MTTWDNFIYQEETDQARFLLDQASAAYDLHPEPADIARQVREYLTMGYQLLDGDLSQFEPLNRFVLDPEMEHCFTAFYSEVEADEAAVAALDIASFACAFTLRMTADNHGLRSQLATPAEEAMPSTYTEYRESARLLGL